MIQWKFRVYVSANNRCDVQKTIDSYDEYGTYAFQRAIEHLAITPIAQWQEPQAKKLKNEDPLYEVRYKANNRQERGLGYFAAEQQAFIITLICYHKGRVYEPPDAFKTARRRMDQIKGGSATSVPLKIYGEDCPADDA